MTAANFWTPKPFEGTGAHAEESNHIRVPTAEKEGVRWFENLHQSIDLLGQPPRCIHVGNYQSSISELDALARKAGTHFLVRTSAERLVEDAGHTISAEMDDVAIEGVQRIDVCNDKGEASTAAVEIKSNRIHNLPLLSKRKRYPAFELTVIHTRERGTPKCRMPIDWMLIEDLPVRTRAEAIEKVGWYAKR